MGSTPDPGGSAPPSFDDFQRQTSLMTSCTLLWKELSDHFSSLERDLIDKSNALKERIRAIDDDTKLSLESLEAREASMANSMAIIMESLENSAKVLAEKKAEVEGGGESESLFEKLRGFCVGMCSKEFWSFVITKKKDLEFLRSEIPKALSCCVDPPRFVLEAVSDAFPVNNYLSKNDESSCNNSIAGCNGYRNHGDMGWACVLLLESLIPVLMDPILGKERMIVTPMIKGKAEEIADAWKRSLEERGGIENVKTPDVHTFLQHLVTFGIVKEEDADFYRKLVVGSAWRKQMPKLAVALGLEDKMPDMIEELIGRGQQVDAVHFIYEVGLADKFPPVPLLKAFLKDAKKASTSLSEDPSGRASQVATKKEQSAIRAVLRCIQEYKLESQFPPEDLSKRLEMLDKAKKKHPTNSSPSPPPPSPSATKRTRGSSGGPMPPAKAGRSTNASYVSSFPSPPTAYVMSSSSSSPTHHAQYPSPVHAYPIYATNHSPPPYGAYSPEIVGSFSVSPVNFPAYGSYGGMAPPPVPGYQQVYY